MSIETTLTVALTALLLGGLLLLRLLIGLIAWIAGKVIDLYAPGRRPATEPAPRTARTHRIDRPKTPLRERSAGLGGALMEIGHDLASLVKGVGQRSAGKSPVAAPKPPSKGVPRPSRPQLAAHLNPVVTSSKRVLGSMRATARDLVSPPLVEGEDQARVIAVESTSADATNGSSEPDAGLIVLESWDARAKELR